MTSGEDRLAAICAALITDKGQLTPAEIALAPKHARLQKFVAEETARSIRDGGDPLGDEFIELRTPELRRRSGATYTPQVIIDAMIAWAANEPTPPARVVDPGAGSGRFVIAAAKRFADAELIAVEIDPLAALILRANASVLGLTNRLRVAVCDYRQLSLQSAKGPTLFVGNPPYVRHHEIDSRWKAWFAETSRRLGFASSNLAGLHIHFFLKTRTLARHGDFGAFITAAEWMDVNYGIVLRRMLADGLGGTALHVIDPKAQPFAKTLSTAAITCFRVGNRPANLMVRNVDSLAKLAPLSAGTAIEWNEVASATRWSTLIRKGRKPEQGEIELGQFFRVHRGQVTGCNAVWIAGPEAAKLPSRFLFPSITRARELFISGCALEAFDNLKRVVDLPVDLDGLSTSEREAIEYFLAWARTEKADESYIARHRKSWWSVGLREPAPILCTYMARRAPAFVRNIIGARHLNIAHGLYPVEPLTDATLDAIIAHLNVTVSASSGRIYAGGLVKFEPGEVSRLHIPDPTVLAANA